MHSYIMFLLGAASAATSVPISVKAESDISKYWTYDSGSTLPLLEKAGMELVVPTTIAKANPGWRKTFSVTITSSGKVENVMCIDCESSDPVAPIIVKSLLLNRFKPSAGNSARLPVVAPMTVSLTPQGR